MSNRKEIDILIEAINSTTTDYLKTKLVQVIMSHKYVGLDNSKDMELMAISTLLTLKILATKKGVDHIVDKFGDMDKYTGFLNELSNLKNNL